MNKLKELIKEEFTPATSYLGSHVINSVNKIINNHQETEPKVDFIKRGDVLRLQEGIKSRPVVVIKVKKDFVMYIPLTSSQNIHATETTYNSRFYGRGFFSKTISIIDVERAKVRFEGVLDDQASLQKAIKEVKEFINSNI